MTKYSLLVAFAILLLRLPADTGSLSLGIRNSLNTVTISLEESYSLAFNESKELFSARTELHIFNQAAVLQLRKFFPQISLNYSNQDSVLFAGNDTTNIRAGVGLKQLIFDGGRNGLQDESLKIQSHIKTRQLGIMEQALKDRVWEAYFQYIFLLQKYELQSELLTLSSEQQLITQKKYALGSITEMQMLESEIQLNNQSLSIAETELQISQLDFQFRKLTGLEDVNFQFSDSISPSYGGIQIPDDPNIAREIIDYAKLHNQELQKMRIQISQTKKHMQMPGILPLISIEGRVSMSGNQFPLQHPEYSVQLHLQFPHKAFPLQISGGITEKAGASFGTNSGVSVSPFQDLQFLIESRSAELQLKNLEYQYKESVTDIEHMIQSTLNSLKQFRKKIDLTKQTLSVQAQQLKISSYQWEKGLITHAEFMKTQMEYQNSTIGLLEAIFQLMQQERQLAATIGVDSLSEFILSPHIKEQK